MADKDVIYASKDYVNYLLDELLKCRNEEIEYAILSLMVNKKVDSHKVFDLYMRAIEYDRNDVRDRLIESNTSLLDLLINLKEPKLNKETTKKNTHNAIHRALYNLNISNQFKMKEMNEKYGYNEDEAKHLSWYWREHNEI